MHSDTQLRRAGFHPLADLPNRSGFTFIGIRHDGTEANCNIQLVGGFHSVRGDARYDDLAAWRPAK